MAPKQGLKQWYKHGGHKGTSTVPTNSCSVLLRWCVPVSVLDVPPLTHQHLIQSVYRIELEEILCLKVDPQRYAFTRGVCLPL